MNTVSAPLQHPGVIAIADIPVVSVEKMRETLASETEAGNRIGGLFGILDEKEKPRLLLVMMADRTGSFHVILSDPGEAYPAFTPDFPQLHLFERQLHEDFGIVPGGHPWLKPVRYTGSADRPGGGNFYTVQGEEVHQVAVGPVHAGIIEPGHFRFNCRGEEVLHLEIALGYQHRGIQGALVGGPDKRTIHYMETAAGDTTIGHSTAYAGVCEALAGIETPARGAEIRAVALELERMANHTGDLGALAGDVGYLPTSSFCGRLRGDVLNLTALICGNRFGRGLILPGGVAWNIEESRADTLKTRLKTAGREIADAVGLIWRTPSVLARFEGCGPVPRETAEDLGLVGPAARASGLSGDTRHSHPAGAYKKDRPALVTAEAGDVAARASVRRDELVHSEEFILRLLENLSAGEILRPVSPLKRNCLAIGAAEGWRGEILHVALTDNAGRFSNYRIVDPSFKNWTGLAMALRKQEISDFPLCNKSFNLSYCGHDL
ncbi:MAG: hypothetical protein JW760_08485 [Spirochaetales bacterium]|nr:hypothetical protein [Spirochaetales bacterium]